jgi:NTP pyrophosphatase (non-canonical NTP hydrolase)
MSPLTLDELTARAVAFRDARDWRQFHSPKELAIALSLEAAEVLELMQWKQGEALQAHLQEEKENLADELSDVLHALVLLAHDQGIDLAGAFEAKMMKNGRKYPVEKCKGKAVKWDRL